MIKGISDRLRGWEVSKQCPSIMYIDCSPYLVCMNKDLHKGNEKVEHEPVVHHLDAGSLGQGLTHAHEHCGQHQHHRQVHRHHRLEEEGLEEVGGVDNTQDEKGGKEGGEELIDDPSI